MKYCVIAAFLATTNATEVDTECKSVMDCPLGEDYFCGELTGCTDTKENTTGKKCVKFKKVLDMITGGADAIKAENLEGCKLNMGSPAIGGLNNDCDSLEECSEWPNEEEGYCAAFNNCSSSSNNSIGKCIKKSWYDAMNKGGPTVQAAFGLADCAIVLGGDPGRGKMT